MANVPPPPPLPTNPGVPPPLLTNPGAPPPIRTNPGAPPPLPTNPVAPPRRPPPVPGGPGWIGPLPTNKKGPQPQTSPPRPVPGKSKSRPAPKSSQPQQRGSPRGRSGRNRSGRRQDHRPRARPASSQSLESDRSGPSSYFSSSSSSSSSFQPPVRTVYRNLRQSFADSPNKNYGGTRGDSAVMNWALTAAAMVSAGVVAGFSYLFLQAYAEDDGAGPQDFKLSYYSCQALFALSILTAVLLALYVLWVFVDSRHPMRKAWLTASQQRRGPVFSAHGKPVQWPGLGTMSFEGVSRITTQRLYAERAHIRKMLLFYGVLLILWCVPFLIRETVNGGFQVGTKNVPLMLTHQFTPRTTLANGYITWKDDKNRQGVKIAEVCGIKKSRDLCIHLAKTGIASAVVTFLLLLNVIVTAVSLMARPVFSTTPRR